MVWKLVPLVSLPVASCPLIVTSLMLPWSMYARNCEELSSCTFWPDCACLTTCHNSSAERAITTQKMIVLTVEFTDKAPEKGRFAFCPGAFETRVLASLTKPLRIRTFPQD